MKKIFLILALAVLVLSGFESSSNSPGGANKMSHKKLRVAMLIPGKIDDRGFMESGYNGLVRIEKELDAQTTYIDQIKPELSAMSEALRTLAKKQPDLIIMHGGQGSEAAKIVSQEFPKIQFIVTQGNVSGPNLSSYEVLQEESAWLAGAAAGLLTKTGTVGHMSGIRVVPGLKGRAAYVDGVKYTNPEARILTSFIGDQDNNELSRKYAEAQINEGADIIFTMLNSGRNGVTETLKEHGLHHIGNVRDYVAEQPDVFIASAVADSGMAGFLAAKSLKEGTYTPNVIKKIGLENLEAIRLTLSSSVPQEVKDTIANLSAKIQNGQIEVATTYDGPEFNLEEN
ncbi:MULTISPECIES: BMP family protein [Neobacillus]|uniref:BMP family protein n=1 Tax=Neobacillus citreus TaxID=2833578 RepID=A0A942T709_9BACI|nr:BMP family protein [Neobacillus citreus]MCH6264585.1 BMP family protein [Neobacillus citreus]